MHDFAVQMFSNDPGLDIFAFGVRKIFYLKERCCPSHSGLPQSSPNHLLAHSFLLERWIAESYNESPHYVKHRKAAFNPSALGPHGCPGKALAFLGIRLVLTRLIWHFDIDLASETQLRRWVEQAIF